jgi:hypothetical protein
MFASANAASIDLSKRHFTHKRAEILMIGTWLRMNNVTRPCIALVRDGAEFSDLCRPYIITLDKAWVWSEDVGDPASAARQCFAICEALRLTPNQQTIFKIVSFVHDFLGDLISMPPFPPSAAPAPVIAEVTVTNRTTGAEHEVVLRDV